MTRSFDDFFDLRLNKRLSKQSWGWWFETPSRSLWRHRNVCHGRLAIYTLDLAAMNNKNSRGLWGGCVWYPLTCTEIIVTVHPKNNVVLLCLHHLLLYSLRKKAPMFKATHLACVSKIHWERCPESELWWFISLDLAGCWTNSRVTGDFRRHAVYVTINYCSIVWIKMRSFSSHRNVTQYRVFRICVILSSETLENIIVPSQWAP